MSEQITPLDLDGDLTWGVHQIAGAEEPARIAMLRADAARGTRTVLVAFPDGWRRDATGNQPAGEEMVVLSGEVRMSGLSCGAGEALVAEPHVTRSATSTDDGTRAVVFFSGAGGGWAEGEAEVPGKVEVLPVEPGVVRGATAGLVGTLEVRADVAGAVLAADADVLWPQARQWAFVPAGATVPDVAGLAVVHLWD
ncbi:hypothetical protein JK386_04730 [Nocardioides sp. zg-536]|uniref:Cupin domain-containing protein n=1 Tax=Nocardioides faecalis TaxID=2803858 RepID=A0A938XZ73_9ACTN|nr:hypothetical protein [Nocardioides faecalis]MBM9459197.1 hypothetical protein [Nocardioides faecalis]QVI59663.1 hypothetical protein KG111_04785 [Nocardioides faecalis]